MQYLRLMVGVIAFLIANVSAMGSVAAEGKKSVAERILDIMRARGHIGEAEYTELLAEARQEAADRQSAPKHAVPRHATPSHAAPSHTSPRQAAPVTERPDTFRVYWDDGLKMDSSDLKFSLALGMRLHNDWAYFDGDDDIEAVFGELGNGTQMRRARLELEGTLHEIIDFEVSYDFAGGDVELKNAWIGLNRLPVVNSLTVGYFKEPFSLEESTSSNDTVFLERGLPNAFVPERNSGIMVNATAFEDRMTWAVGAFREVDDFGEGFGRDSEYNLTARVTAAPWYAQKGRRLLHLGLGYSRLFRANDEIRFRARPETGLGDRFVDTGTLLSDGVHLLGAEAAFVHDSFSLQGEYIRALVDTAQGKSLDFDGFYILGSYFLTGETRSYKLAKGAFARVRPIDNFDGKGGLGAWELALRYARLDLNDATVSGGNLGVFTVGMNWYLNPNLRLMGNYGWANPRSVGHAHLLQMRAQVNF